MNKAFEKILERLEEYEYNDLIEHDSEQCEHCKRIDCGIGMDCSICVMDKAKEIVQEVAEEYVPDTNVGSNGWIMCDVKMPEERDSIFAQFKGTDKWKNSMFERMSEFVNATVEFEDGTRMVKSLHTVDGKWHMGSGFLKYKVIAWKPLPSPFREIEVSE